MDRQTLLATGRKDGWMEGKAGLRIAYSNQKLYHPFYTNQSNLRNPNNFVKISDDIFCLKSKLAYVPILALFGFWTFGRRL